MLEAVGGWGPASFKDLDGPDSPRPVCGHVRASQVRVVRNLSEGRWQEWALVLTRHRPNCKQVPTQMDIFMLKAELEESGLPCLGYAPVRDS